MAKGSSAVTYAELVGDVGGDGEPEGNPAPQVDHPAAPVRRKKGTTRRGRPKRRAQLQSPPHSEDEQEDDDIDEKDAPEVAARKAGDRVVKRARTSVDGLPPRVLSSLMDAFVQRTEVGRKRLYEDLHKLIVEQKSGEEQPKKPKKDPAKAAAKRAEEQQQRRALAEAASQSHRRQWGIM